VNQGDGDDGDCGQEAKKKRIPPCESAIVLYKKGDQVSDSDRGGVNMQRQSGGCSARVV
jgi:hypothetical protein